MLDKCKGACHGGRHVGAIGAAPEQQLRRRRGTDANGNSTAGAAAGGAAAGSAHASQAQRSCREGADAHPVHPHPAGVCQVSHYNTALHSVATHTQRCTALHSVAALQRCDAAVLCCCSNMLRTSWYNNSMQRTLNLCDAAAAAIRLSAAPFPIKLRLRTQPMQRPHIQLLHISYSS
eukprot:359979-Chlamydomonas_euryale.AAC.5